MFPDFIVTRPGDTAYPSRAQALYRAQQQSGISPACYVHVRSASDISAVVFAVRSTQCPFAIRGAGHSNVPGASNSPGGITIDISGLYQLEIDDSGEIIRVGAGLRWGEVYAQLEPKNLTVVGGRLTDVGVGGLILGCGISFYTGLHGFACDNVRSFEVSKRWVIK